MVGMLVACSGFNVPSETVFQSISCRLPERSRKKREKLQTDPSASTVILATLLVMIFSTPLRS